MPGSFRTLFPHFIDEVSIICIQARLAFSYLPGGFLSTHGHEIFLLPFFLCVINKCNNSVAAVAIC